MKEIGLEDLKKAHRKVSEEAQMQNRALGLTYIEVQNDKLVSVSSDGQETVIGTPRFGTKRIGLKHFRLDEKQKV